MRNCTIPKGIQKWIDKNRDKIADYWFEADGFSGDHLNPYAIWLYFEPGWICDGVHLIHECTQKDFLAMTDFIKPCTCLNCEEESKKVG